MITTANPQFGFHGEMAHRYGAAVAALTYDIAARELLACGFNELGARLVLDSPCGRHWADAISLPTPEGIAAANPAFYSWFRLFPRRPRRPRAA